MNKTDEQPIATSTRVPPADDTEETDDKATCEERPIGTSTRVPE